MRKLKKQIKQEAEQVSEALISIAERFVSLLNVRLPKVKFRNPHYVLKTALVILLLFVNSVTTTSYNDNKGASAMTNQINPLDLYVSEVRDRFEERIIKEVETYIKKMAPESKLSADLLVEKCLEYNTDIIFVLAQGVLESHFGTKGLAEKTNSVWNVGAYDGQKPRNWYDSPDESLEPYLKLVNEKYLINITAQGDTIYKDLYHLVEDRGYTNYAGKRFASARGYENAMRKFMVRIDMETSIGFYQNVLSLSNEELLAYFAPRRESLDYRQFQAMNF